MTSMLRRLATILALGAASAAAPGSRLAAQPRPFGGDTLVVATYAYASNDRLANVVPLAEHLEQRLGRPVRATSR